MLEDLHSFPTRRSSDLTGGALIDTDTVNITVTAPNAAPVVTTTAGNLSYTENAAATAIDPALTVTDSDNANLVGRSEEHTSELQSHVNLVCRLLLEKKN